MDSASFTFLATILILVLLSTSLVLRSYVLRRRYRLRFHQALADGLIVGLDRTPFDGPLNGPRRQPRRFGPKPVLWDAWIHAPDSHDAWSSLTPVAVRCTSPSKPPPSPITPASPPSPPRASLLSHLRLPSLLSLSSSSRQASTSVGSLTASSPRSPPPTGQTSPNPIRAEKNPSTLAVCVLVAMPDPSAPVHLPSPYFKGKNVDPLASQAHQRSGDAIPLLSSSLHPRIPTDEGLPLLEFGLVKVRTDWTRSA